MSNSDILAKAFRGEELLRERQKSLTKEHAERRKKLIGLMRSVNKEIFSRGGGGAQGEIKEAAALSLTPDLEELLANPLKGL